MYKYSEDSIRMNIQFPDAAVALEAAHLQHELEAFKAADICLTKSRYRVSVRINLSHDMYIILAADAPLVGNYRSIFEREPAMAEKNRPTENELTYRFAMTLRSNDPATRRAVDKQEISAATLQKAIVRSLSAAIRATDRPVRLKPRERRSR